MTFWVGVAVLLLAALGFVLVPAWRRAKQAGTQPVTGLIAAALLVPFAIGLYARVTTWSDDPNANAALPAVADMVTQLAERLQQNPNDVDGWRLLGQSYIAMGRYPEARGALREAWRRTQVPDNELRIALAEAEALNDRESLAGEAGALFAVVLETDPANQKALWYGGLAALMTQQPELARERWSRLLALDPPEQIAEILRKQVEALGGASSATETGVADAGPDASAVRLMIHVADDLQTQVPESASLFIFARSPDGGPPVAVLRQPAAALPAEFELGDANAMIPGRSLRDFATLTIVARISRSGQPMEQPGDLFGQISYRPGEDLAVQEIVIDQAVP
jgi:cytochrome c-type biogenesis protein CcmH